jgi:hypothetical protein
MSVNPTTKTTKELKAMMAKIAKLHPSVEFRNQWPCVIKLRDTIFYKDMDQIGYLTSITRDGLPSEIREWLNDNGVSYDSSRVSIGFRHENDAFAFKLRFC